MGYTAYNHNTDEILGRGLTLAEAAIARLTYDGAKFDLVERYDETEIVRVDRHRAATPLYDGPAPHGRLLIEWKGTRQEQIARLYQRVITANWKCPVVVTTDEEFDNREAACPDRMSDSTIAKTPALDELTSILQHQI
jgi:hypothetical protein